MTATVRIYAKLDEIMPLSPYKAKIEFDKLFLDQSWADDEYNHIVDLYVKNKLKYKKRG